jgi:hypothetical protein
MIIIILWNCRHKLVNITPKSGPLLKHEISEGGEGGKEYAPPRRRFEGVQSGWPASAERA